MTAFYVKVSVNQNEFHIDTSGTYPRIGITAPAEQGRANSELVNVLTEIIGEPVRIVSGHHSRRKELAVEKSKDAVINILESHEEA